ncbi:MAG TPA: hypothetical protein VG275_06855 [Solirubrobacteraceae bacterium]|jgi:hypothetical protein|nr:hypothetical protein [Solirubrobacteraceae bacterium]
MARLVLDRPARLRRLAELVDGQAGAASDPDAARELARSMRLRATEIECGYDHDLVDEVLDDEKIAEELAEQDAEVERARWARLTELFQGQAA